MWGWTGKAEHSIQSDITDARGKKKPSLVRCGLDTSRTARTTVMQDVRRGKKKVYSAECYAHLWNEIVLSKVRTALFGEIVHGNAVLIFAKRRRLCYIGIIILSFFLLKHRFQGKLPLKKIYLEIYKLDLSKKTKKLQHFENHRIYDMSPFCLVLALISNVGGVTQTQIHN